MPPAAAADAVVPGRRDHRDRSSGSSWSSRSSRATTSASRTTCEGEDPRVGADRRARDRAVRQGLGAGPRPEQVPGLPGRARRSIDGLQAPRGGTTTAPRTEGLRPRAAVRRGGHALALGTAVPHRDDRHRHPRHPRRLRGDGRLDRDAGRRPGARRAARVRPGVLAVPHHLAARGRRRRRLERRPRPARAARSPACCCSRGGLVVAGTATSFGALLVGRAVSGLGGGLQVVTLYVVVAAVYPQRLQPRVFGAISAAWVLPARARAAGRRLARDAGVLARGVPRWCRRWLCCPCRRSGPGPGDPPRRSGRRPDDGRTTGRTTGRTRAGAGRRRPGPAAAGCAVRAVRTPSSRSRRGAELGGLRGSRTGAAGSARACSSGACRAAAVPAVPVVLGGLLVAAEHPGLLPRRDAAAGPGPGQPGRRAGRCSPAPSSAPRRSCRSCSSRSAGLSPALAGVGADRRGGRLVRRVVAAGPQLGLPLSRTRCSPVGGAVVGVGRSRCSRHAARRGPGLGACRSSGPSPAPGWGWRCRARACSPCGCRAPGEEGRNSAALQIGDALGSVLGIGVAGAIFAAMHTAQGERRRRLRAPVGRARRRRRLLARSSAAGSRTRRGRRCRCDVAHRPGRRAVLAAGVPRPGPARHASRSPVSRPGGLARSRPRERRGSGAGAEPHGRRDRAVSAPRHASAAAASHLPPAFPERAAVGHRGQAARLAAGGARRLPALRPRATSSRSPRPAPARRRSRCGSPPSCSSAAPCSGSPWSARPSTSRGSGRTPRTGSGSGWTRPSRNSQGAHGRALRRRRRHLRAGRDAGRCCTGPAPRRPAPWSSSTRSTTAATRCRWGDAVRDAFEPAARRLALTGTPFRSDTSPIPFVEYEAGRDGRPPLAGPTTPTATATRCATASSGR